MKRFILLLLLWCPLGWAQYTSVSATIVDPNGLPYQNCTYSASFVGQSSAPGPYLLSGSVFQTNYSGARCDSFGNLSSGFVLADNNIVQPTPSQWQINFCDQTGKYCGQALITITGASMNISTQLRAVAPVLPGSGGGTGSVLPGTAGQAGYYGVTGSTIYPQTALTFAGQNATFSGNATVGLNFNVGGSIYVGAPLAVCTTPNIVPGCIGLPDSSGPANPTAGQLGIRSLNGVLNCTGDGAPEAPCGGGSSGSSSGVVTVTPNFNFTACATGCTIVTGGATTLVAGSNTVTLTPCPLGVNGTDSPHYLSLSPGSGDPTPEWFLITGGTCTSGATSGTITFTAAYSHLANYIIGSATSGIQEAYYTVAPPGISIALVAGTNYTLSAPLFVRGGASLLAGNFATITHASFNTAIYVGAGTSFGASGGGEGYDIKNLIMVAGNVPWSVIPTGSISGSSPNATLTIPTCPAGFYANIPGQLLWLAGTASGLPTTVYGYGEFVLTTGGGSTCLPGVTNGTVNITQATPGVTNLSPHDNGSSLSFPAGPYFEDAAGQGAHFHDIKWVSPNTITLQGGNGFHFNNDQSASIDNIDMNAGYGWRLDSDFQASAVFAPGPSGPDSAILSYGPNVNVGSTTIGSCVRWYSGNDFGTVGQNVCQDYSTGGITVGLKRGGFGQFTINAGIHFENAGVASPWGVPLGNPAIMSIGGLNKPLVNHSITFGAGVGFSTAGDAAYPQFQPTPASQTTQQYYYLVAHQNTVTGCTSGGDCLSIPTLIGNAVVNDPSANNVTVNWYGWGSGTYGASSYMPVATYDLLRVSGAFPSNNILPPAPSGTGTYLVASGINPATACSIHNLCTFLDNVAPASLTSYAVQSSQTGNKNFYPLVQLLPGNVALTGQGRAGNGTFRASAGTMLYRGTPTCLNSMEYFGANYVASFLGMAFGSEGDIGFGCPAQYAPINNEGYGLGCWTQANPALCTTSKHMTVVIGPSPATTVVIDTSAIQPFSRVTITEDRTQGTNLGVTCDTVAGFSYSVSSVVYGTSLTIAASSAPTGKKCVDVDIQ